MKIALFPGSFDPFTAGHQALVDEGLAIFDRVIIAIGDNCEKAGLLSVENRKRLIEDIYKDDKRVETVVYKGLTGDFCRAKHIKFILRGMRNTIDFEYERNMMLINKQLYPEIITIELFTPIKFIAISSSVIREIVGYGGDVKELMPKEIKIKNYL